MALAALLLAALPLVSPADLPPQVHSAPRLDFVDEICSYDWMGDRWGCDAERLKRVPHEIITTEPGTAALVARPLRWARGAKGQPVLLEPEERGQDPDNWGPRPMWACISGVEVDAPDDVTVEWERAEWLVNGAPAGGADVQAATELRGTFVQGKQPPCVGPRLLFQSDESLEVALKLPYRHGGQASVLTWRYEMKRAGIDEGTAMAAVTPPRRWRGRVPEAPDPKTVTRVIPVGTCLGALAAGVGVAAITLGQPAAGAPNATALTVAAYAAAFIPLVAGIAVDGTLFAIWMVEGVQHFRYDIALGTLRHWDRSRAAYESQMSTLGLPAPVDY